MENIIDMLMAAEYEKGAGNALDSSLSNAMIAEFEEKYAPKDYDERAEFSLKLVDLVGVCKEDCFKAGFAAAFTLLKEIKLL